MELPNSASILGIPYDVVVEDMEDGEDGCISPRKRRITLRRGMCREKE